MNSLMSIDEIKEAIEDHPQGVETAAERLWQLGHDLDEREHQIKGLTAEIEALRKQTQTWHPESEAPKGVKVLVRGGIAMKKTGGVWYTGMEEPLFERPIEWEVDVWAHIPAPQEQT